MKFALVLSAIALSLASSFAHAANQKSSDPSIKDFLRGKGTTYMVRFYELTTDGSSSSKTVECHEGLLEDVVVQHPSPEFPYIGNVEFKRGPLWLDVQVNSQSYDSGSKQGVLSANVMFFPNFGSKGFGYQIGYASLSNMSTNFQEGFSTSASILENGMAFQDQFQKRQVKELGASLLLNGFAKYNCAYWMNENKK